MDQVGHSDIEEAEDALKSEAKKVLLLIGKAKGDTAESWVDFNAHCDRFNKLEIQKFAELVLSRKPEIVLACLRNNLEHMLQFARDSEATEGREHTERLFERASNVAGWLLALNLPLLPRLNWDKIARYRARLATSFVWSPKDMVRVESIIRLMRSAPPISLPSNLISVNDNKPVRKAAVPEGYVRMSCSEVGKLCDQSKTWAHEQHLRDEVGWRPEKKSRKLYWNEAWLKANKRKQ